MELSVQVSVLVVLALSSAFAAEESCAGRCGIFDSQWRCQCDSMCVYHRSCCQDFQTVCRRKINRGDVFGDYDYSLLPTSSVDEVAFTTTTTVAPPAPTTVASPAPTTVASPAPTTIAPPATTTVTPPATTTRVPTSASNPDAVSCSGRPFDAFLQLKNGSIYAFRGEYFFELDDSSVLPGYPRLIKDVWGIPGPIDAAFTRINCQGKTYLFKGSEYWRFEGDVLDDDYPRSISTGFENMPNDVDAAFAIPAPSFSGTEKAYFFKGSQYYKYDFKNQPNHEDCVAMTRSSPSLMFTRYTSLYHRHPMEELLKELFQSPFQEQGARAGPRLISRDWMGIKPPIDAAMVGQLYLSPAPTAAPTVPRPPGRRRWRGRRRHQRRRQSRQGRSLSYYLPDIFSLYDPDDYGSHYDSVYDYNPKTTTQASAELASRCSPVQHVYFFKDDKYYRANLKTKQVDHVSPRYPRSIAKYWLGCDQEASVHVSIAEKK